MTTQNEQHVSLTIRVHKDVQTKLEQLVKEAEMTRAGFIVASILMVYADRSLINTVKKYKNASKRASINPEALVGTMDKDQLNELIRLAQSKLNE